MVRGAPCDALVAEIAPRELRGAAFGLRQSLDSVGAFVGPLLALAAMAWLSNNIRAVLWIAVVPAFVAVALLIFGMREPEGTHAGSKPRLTLADARRLNTRYWLVVLLGAMFTLSRFSEAFLILRAQDVGIGLGHVPLVLIVMNVVYTASAYPAGAAADRLKARTILIIGMGMLVLADLVLASAATPLLALAGAALWGAHMGLTQGLFSKLVADAAPADLLGSAFGAFNLVTGAALLLANVLAGALWTAYGAPATFLAGSGFAILTLLGLAGWRRRA